MPQVGERKRAELIGHKGRAMCVFDACPKCQKPRWVRIKVAGCLCNKCAAEKRAKNYRGELSSLWRSGIHKHSDGYTMVVLTPDSPYYKMACQGVHRVLAHRLVMAVHLGRCLESWEIVHHKNNDKADNRLENLELVTSHINMAYTRQDARIKELEEQVGELQEDVKLLRWHIRNLQYGNPEPSREFGSRACVETRGVAPQEGDGIVQP